ncbi:MAG: dockerin type I repeat-containing protein [Muribaculaceae bacterium]|nr:dockerin type I repeat-containing protein [Muribaculaceae bacterium]
MKKSLLFVAALALAITANAQLARNHGASQTNMVATQQLKDVKIEHRTAQRAGDVVTKSARPNRVVPANSAYYLRPKGTMYCNWNKEGSGFVMPFVNTKPYDTVTFRNMSTATGTPSWGYWLYEFNEQAGGYQRDSLVSNDYDLTVKYGYEYEDIPALKMGGVGPYELSGYNLRTGNSATSGVASVPNSEEIYSGFETNMIASAHYYGSSDRFGKQQYGWTYYSGAQGPDGEEDSSGYWFGKNYSGWNVFGVGFEKPVSPYVLNAVYFWATDVAVTEDVELECRVYRVRDLPAYSNTSAAVIDCDAVLTEGALIATGKAKITPELIETEGDSPIFEFLLKEIDPEWGIEYDTTPEISDAIVIVILGADQDGITSLSGLVTNDSEDEGVGEVTFLGHQEGGIITALRGLNNFFASGDAGLELKAGGSIFIDVTRPFITTNYGFETGEYTFANNGGRIAYQLDDGSTLNGVNFYATSPKADWTVSTADYEEIPDWLTITLSDDMENGEWASTVTADITCAALPSGLNGREAMIRFAINGAYYDYHIIQGNGGPTFTFSPEAGDYEEETEVTVTASPMPSGATMQIRFDVFNGEMGEWEDASTFTVEETGDMYARLITADGSVIATSEVQEYNITIAEPEPPIYPVGDVNGDMKVDVEDVNAVINIILELKTEAEYPGNADVTGDGKVDVEDVNAIINIILAS